MVISLQEPHVSGPSARRPLRREAEKSRTRDSQESGSADTYISKTKATMVPRKARSVHSMKMTLVMPNSRTMILGLLAMTSITHVLGATEAAPKPWYSRTPPENEKKLSEEYDIDDVSSYLEDEGRDVWIVHQFLDDQGQPEKDSAENVLPEAYYKGVILDEDTCIDYNKETLRVMIRPTNVEHLLKMANRETPILFNKSLEKLYSRTVQDGDHPMATIIETGQRCYILSKKLTTYKLCGLNGRKVSFNFDQNQLGNVTPEGKGTYITLKEMKQLRKDQAGIKDALRIREEKKQLRIAEAKLKADLERQAKEAAAKALAETLTITNVYTENATYDEDMQNTKFWMITSLLEASEQEPKKYVMTNVVWDGYTWIRTENPDLYTVNYEQLRHYFTHRCLGNALTSRRRLTQRLFRGN